MTDHAEFFDSVKLDAYARECESLSDDRFRFIAGLEYTCDKRMHVLGLGVTSLAGTTDPQQVIRYIEDQAGLSVIAHPMDSMFDSIETFETLPNGIETWNSKYDGRYAPRPRTFRLLERLQQRKPEMCAFYGIDLHWRKQFRGLLNIVQTTELSPQPILSAIRAGDYFAMKGELELPSSGVLSEGLIARFKREHARSDRLRRIAKKVKKATSRVGLAPTGGLKAQLRRIF